MDEKFSFRSFLKRDVNFALLFMTILSLYNIFTKKTIIDLGYWNATIWIALLTTLFTLPSHFLVLKEYKTVNLKKIAVLILIGIIGIIGYLASNKAFEQSVGLSSVIISLPFSMVMAFVFSLFAPRLLEKHTFKVYLIRFTAAAIMFYCALKIS